MAVRWYRVSCFPVCWSVVSIPCPRERQCLGWFHVIGNMQGAMSLLWLCLIDHTDPFPTKHQSQCHHLRLYACAGTLFSPMRDCWKDVLLNFTFCNCSCCFLLLLFLLLYHLVLVFVLLVTAVVWPIGSKEVHDLMDLGSPPNAIAIVVTCCCCLPCCCCHCLLLEVVVVGSKGIHDAAVV